MQNINLQDTDHMKEWEWISRICSTERVELHFNFFFFFNSCSFKNVIETMNKQSVLFLVESFLLK